MADHPQTGFGARLARFEIRLSYGDRGVHQKSVVVYADGHEEDAGQSLKPACCDSAALLGAFAAHARALGLTGAVGSGLAQAILGAEHAEKRRRHGLPPNEGPPP